MGHNYTNSFSHCPWALLHGVQNYDTHKEEKQECLATQFLVRLIFSGTVNSLSKCQKDGVVHLKEVVYLGQGNCRTPRGPMQGCALPVASRKQFVVGLAVKA